MTEIRRLEACDRWWLEVDAESKRLDLAKQTENSPEEPESANAAVLTERRAA